MEVNPTSPPRCALSAQGELDFLWDGKSKTSLMIIARAFQCHGGGSQGREGSSLSFLSLTLYLL